MQRVFLIHTASLYYWYEPYETHLHLEERIHAALDAGFDGVEISNGPSIIDFAPSKETISRLRKSILTLHAEFYDSLRLPELLKFIQSFPVEIDNIIVHPDELSIAELKMLPELPFHVSLENMDSRHPQWSTESTLKPYISGLDFCYDTAHARENELDYRNFSFSPGETHVSIPNEGNYYNDLGWETYHAMTQFAPDKFPSVPSSCPIITIEGLIPPDQQALKDELDFVKSKLA
jgi:hypothetical protein